MKKPFAFLVLISMIVPSLAQELPDYSIKKNELNLGYFNAFELNGLGELGIGYKRLGEKGAFRTGIGMDFGKNVTDYATSNSTISRYTFSPRLGYEFHQWYKRIRVHYGGDAVTSFSKNTSADIPEDQAIDRFDSYKTFSGGLRPFLGLTVYLTKSISIATETYMDISFYKTTQERIRGEETTSYESQGMNVGLGPLGIVSVNFHF